MKKLNLLLAIMIMAAVAVGQSVGINSDGSAPDGSAMLDVKSTSKGFLPPRVALTGTTDVSTISSPATGLLIYNTATASDVTPGYYYYNGSSWIKVGSASDATQWTTTGSDIYYNSGNVGIGIASTTHDLDISGNNFRLKAPSSHSSYLVIDNTDADQLSTIALQTQGGEGLAYIGLGGSSYSSFGGNNALNFWNQSPNGPISFGTNNGSATAERMRIDKDGNVGIGTTTPSQKLDVVGYGRFYNESGISKMTIQTNSANQASVDLLNNTLSARWILDANDLFRVYNQTSGFDAFVVKANGYVGIGTTTPGAKLHIGGFGYGVVTGIAMSPVNNTEGGHYITFHNFEGTGIGSIERGAGNTVVYSTSSDYRLKENVVNLSANQAKTRLMALRPVEYNYISDTNKTVISGFLAHEMADAGFANGVTGEKDAIDKDGKPIYQAIDTKFLIPEMVKVIQEQQQLIED